MASQRHYPRQPFMSMCSRLLTSDQSIDSCSVPFPKEDSAILAVFSWDAISTAALAMLQLVWKLFHSFKINWHRNGAVSGGIFLRLCHTFHGTGHRGNSSRATLFCTEWQLGQKKHTEYEGFPHSWCNALDTADSMPFDLHCRQIDSVSIPSRVMCSSCTAMISSGSIATQGAGGARVLTVKLLKLFSAEHHSTRKSPKIRWPLNHNWRVCVFLSTRTIFWVVTR